MTPELRRALERKAERLERRLGIVHVQRESMTTSERQAADLLGRYRDPSPRPRTKGLTTTERQVLAMGGSLNRDVEFDDDDLGE